MNEIIIIVPDVMDIHSYVVMLLFTLTLETCFPSQVLKSQVEDAPDQTEKPRDQNIYDPK